MIRQNIASRKLVRLQPIFVKFDRYWFKRPKDEEEVLKLVRVRQEQVLNDIVSQAATEAEEEDNKNGHKEKAP